MTILETTPERLPGSRRVARKAPAVAPEEPRFLDDPLVSSVEHWRTERLRPSWYESPEETPDVFYSGGLLVVVHSTTTSAAPVTMAAPALEPNARAYVVAHLGIWLVLIVAVLTWGVLTGLSFSGTGFWLNPLTALFGCFALLGLAGTLFIAGRSRRV